MKKSFLLLTLCLPFLNSCKDPVCGCAPPLLSRLHGQWEWVKTQTPSGTITPEQTGVTKDINFVNDNMDSYIIYYQADTLVSKLIMGLDGHQENEKENTILVRFNPKGYMKFTLNQNLMETSALLNEYSVQSDTVRHYYRYKGEARK